MTKKRKFYILFSVLFLIMYLLTAAFFFQNTYGRIYADYNEYQIKMLEFLGNAATWNDITSDDIMNRFYDYLNIYPTKAVLYNENGDIKKKSGSHIQFNDENNKSHYINIDEYLTDDIRKQLVSFGGNNYNFEIEEFSYTMINDEIIPVSIRFAYAIPEIKLTEYSDYETITKYTPNNTMIFARFIDLDKDHYRHSSYIKAEAILEENKKDIIDTFKNGVSIGVLDDNSFYQAEYIPTQDGYYVLAIGSEINLFSETIHNGNFSDQMKTFSIVFLILYFLFFFIFRKAYLISEQNERIKTAFTSAAAHELKTPLAVIENQCECIMENVAPDKNAEYMNSIYSESLRMNKLVASLLQYNRLATANKIRKEENDLSEILNSEIEKYSRLITDKKIHLETEIHNSCKVKCNKELIALVIDNFLSNAIKHTESGNKIKAELKKQGKKYRLSVYNEGKHIPEEELKNIWNLLNKTDKSRNRDDNSTGMGLTICREILKHHKYTFGVFNEKDGVEFYFTAK